MRFSKKCSSFFYLIFLCLIGCATSSYKVSRRDGRKVELGVSPDRILAQCKIESENTEVPYGFMTHVLDDKLTVLDVVQTNTLDEKSCRERIERIRRILETGHKIYIAGYGDIDDPIVIEPWVHKFPKFGTFNANGRMLQFSAIANEHGACYSAQFRDEKPCPRDEFPIGK